MKRLILLFPVFLLFGTLFPAAASTKLALVIGNSEYETAPLKNPRNDARLFAETLQSLGFSVHFHLEVDQRGLRRAISDYGRALEEAGPETINVIYFAGHGVQIGNQNYLVPVKADIRHERDVPIEAVSADEIMKSLAYSETQMNLVILDACRNNPYARSFRSGAQGLARMEAPRGTLLAYSTAPGSVALDGSGRYSPYTASLVRAMNQPGLPIEAVFKRTRVAVMERTNDEQVPWESSSLTGEFSFLPQTGGGATASGATDPEIVFWTSIVNTDDASLFDDYLKRYPDGMFRGIAEQRLSSLSGSGQVRAAGGVEISSGPLQFSPGKFTPRVIRTETECSRLSFKTVTLKDDTGRGRWSHPDAYGSLLFDIEDGIISARMKGSEILYSKETVQVRGRDLLVRIHTKYSAGQCKIAFVLAGAIAP